MFSDTTIAFVGSGSMGEAMIAGLVNQKLIDPRHIIASGPRPERGETLRQKYGICVTTGNRQAVASAQVVVLSIKPQLVPVVLPELKGHIQTGALVLSIIAGARMEILAQGLLHTGIIRSMPNSPAQIGQGITVWTASADVTDRQRQQAEAILGACGQQIFVGDEDYLDMATALSGTGPAYVFLFMEALADGGVQMGLARDVALKLAIQTVYGAAKMALESNKHLGELKDEVTSPGGTTIAGLYAMEQKGFHGTVMDAVVSATLKSQELGKG